MTQIVRLVRVQDRTLGDAPHWKLNPRTQFLESVAPLTWTGVRSYRVGDGEVRVLRRWGQVGSEGHKATLRTLPTPKGHPAGDVDITPANAAELTKGYTGDTIIDKVVDGYMVPTSRIAVFDPVCIELMTREVDPLTQTSLGYNALWWSPRTEEIVSEGPDGLVGQWQGPNGPELYDIEHILDPKCEVVLRLVRDSGFDSTQLGANHFAIALDRGRGGAQSELLRVVDSLDIPIGTNPVSVSVPRDRDEEEEPTPQWAVGADRNLALVEDAIGDVRDRTRGRVKALTALGAARSANKERLLKGQKPQIGGKSVSQRAFAAATHSRPSSAVKSAISQAGSKSAAISAAHKQAVASRKRARSAARAVKGKPGARVRVARDWSEAEAANSIFDWAGWPDVPDPSKARRGFLLYDMSAPTDEDSYQVPIAQFNSETDQLEVSLDSLAAAVDTLGEFDLPPDIVDQALDVLEDYFMRFEEGELTPVSRDFLQTFSKTGKPMSTEIIEKVTLGLGRDVESKLRARGITIPAPYDLRVRDMDAEKIRMAIESIQETAAQMLVMLGEAEEKMGDAEAMSAEKEQMGGELAALKEKVAGMEEAMAKSADALGLDKTTPFTAADMAAALVKTLNELTIERDSLRVEVEPLRQEAFARARDVAQRVGVSEDELAKATTLAAVKRLAVVHKYGEARMGKVSDDAVAGAFVSLELAEPTNTEETPAAAVSSGFASGMPTPTLPTPARDADPKKSTTSATLRANLRAL